jgi:hypothetical protein
VTAFKAGDSQLRRAGRSAGLGVEFDIYWLAPDDPLHLLRCREHPLIACGARLRDASREILTRQIDQFGAPRVITTKARPTAPNGGSGALEARLPRLSGAHSSCAMG